MSPIGGKGVTAPDPPPPKERKYVSGNGPFTVFIRELDIPLQPIKFSVHIHRVYPSVTSIMKTAPGKIRVVLKKMEEANLLPTDTHFKAYKVYIPMDLVEIAGVIEYPVDEDMAGLMADGRGKFLNPIIPSVDIVGVNRITIEGKTTEDSNKQAMQVDESAPASTSRASTPLVRVNFTGTVLPDRVEIYGLLIKVRPLKSNPMFCDRCQNYGHTNKFCKRAIRCNKCGQKHNTDNCSVAEEQCINCKVSGHSTGSSSCPFMADLRKKSVTKAAVNRKRTFAEIVRVSNEKVHVVDPLMNQAGPSSRSSGSFQSVAPSSSEATFPTSKKAKNLKANSSKRGRSVSPVEAVVFPAKKKKEKPREDFIPPGLRGQKSTSLCAAFIQKLCKNLNLSPFWINIVNTIILPIVETIVSQFSPMLTPLIAMMNLNYE